MAPIRPITDLDTHRVTNQPPPLEDIDLFSSDVALRQAVRNAGGGQHEALLQKVGRIAGSAEAQQWAMDANRYPPVLETHDRYGRRLDEVRFHPAYHRLMQLGLDHGVAALPWNGTPAGHVAHAAILYLVGEADAGVQCPMTMTYAAGAALQREPALAREWLPRITASRYDPVFRPAAEKQGVTFGMGMTEKQGGSDVRSNSTTAEAATDGADDGWFRLTGHKWFCSAPMSDAFLTLAQLDGELTCFLLPRWLPDGHRNAGFRIVRLKDKLGDRSNASAEVEYHGALAQQLGPKGKGIATILDMVQHTRLDCVHGSAQQMRGALVQAMWHAMHRRAFGKKLLDQPVMANLLADLALESEGATAFGFFLAACYDRADPLARLLTPLAKFRICKRAPQMIYEAMECLGGNGYIETGPMARLFRQSPLNAIWEGSGNVIALDILRGLKKENAGAAALRAFLEQQRGRQRAYDRWLDDLSFEPVTEGQARLVAGRLALAAEAAILLQWEHPLAEAFIALRLGEPHACYGAFASAIDRATILQRAMPAI